MNLQPETFSLQPDSDVLVRVSGVSKKFCLSLKKSLWYGLKDMGNELLGRRHGGNGELRPKEFWAVHDVGFELKRGESLGLIGHNGAGKTTLLKMLNGLIKPDAGRIEMRGRVGALIALGAGFNPILTGRENIYVNASVLGLSKRETDAKIDEIIDFAEIGDFIETPVQNYSSGMAVRLGFAVASSLNPDVLLLDEVLAVGDMGFQAKCFNRLGEMRRKGIAFILVSHNMHHISRYCERVLYLKHGRIAHCGDAARGIAAFEADMQAPAVRSAGGAETFGSGKIKIVSVGFRDEAGRELAGPHLGTRPISLVVGYECPATVSDAVWDVIIQDGQDVVFQGRSDGYGRVFDFAPGRGALHVRFESLPVRKSPLYVSCCLMDRTTAEIYDWRRNVELPMRWEGKCVGQIAPAASWSLLPE